MNLLSDEKILKSVLDSIDTGSKVCGHGADAYADLVVDETTFRALDRLELLRFAITGDPEHASIFLTRARSSILACIKQGLT